MFSDLEINGGEDYVPYVSQDPLNDPKSFIFRIKVYLHCFLFCVKRNPTEVIFNIFWHVPVKHTYIKKTGQ